MQSYKALAPYFTTGTAEAEENIIDSAYVSTEGIIDIINPPLASPRLLVGKKGSGKSIILRYFKNRFNESGIPILLLRPSDIDSSRLPKDTSLGALIRYYKNEIIGAIAAHMGRELKGYLSTNEDILLSKIAKDAKARSGDWFERTLEFIVPLGAGIAKIDYGKLAASIGDVSQGAVENAIRTTLGKQEKFFYFLFDDTDQVADPSDSHHLNRIWAFILALRQIMERCPNIRCIVTLRAEVWIRLGRDNGTQRDQVDHVRNLVVELNPTDEDVRDIAERRFELARKQSNLPQANDHTAIFFEGDVVLPHFDEARSWYDFLVKRSRERPRDMVQLVAKLIDSANKDKQKPDKIKSTHAANIIDSFSKERVEDLKREVEDECPAIDGIIRTFASAQFDIAGYSMKANTLLDHLMRVPSQCSVVLYGRHLKQMDEPDAYVLWRYLFDIGFLGARYADPDKPKGFDHRSARDDATLISKDRRQELDLIPWDINPAYRDFLHSIRAVQYLGLPNLGAKQRVQRPRD